MINQDVYFFFFFNLLFWSSYKSVPLWPPSFIGEFLKHEGDRRSGRGSQAVLWSRDYYLWRALKSVEHMVGHELTVPLSAMKLKDKPTPWRGEEDSWGAGEVGKTFVKKKNVIVFARLSLHSTSGESTVYTPQEIPEVCHKPSCCPPFAQKARFPVPLRTAAHWLTLSFNEGWHVWWLAKGGQFLHLSWTTTVPVGCRVFFVCVFFALEMFSLPCALYIHILLLFGFLYIVQKDC